jgi:protocatechuate 4,5-dioxygenase alpha chain
VQATCHGADNRAMVDACIASQGKARGVATVRRSVSDNELHAMHAAGVRGVRFNFVKRLVDFTPKDELLEIAHRIAPLGWHVVIYFEAVDLPELWDFFTALPTTVVVDHMGRPDVGLPVDGPQFALFEKVHARTRQCVEQGQLPRAPVITGPKALARRTGRLPRRGALCAPHRRDLSRPCAVGHRLAAPQPEGPHARRRPAGGLHPAHRTHCPNCSTNCWWPTPCACTGPRRPEMALQRPYLDVPGTTIFDAEQSRKGYHLNQFCMSLMKAANRERFKADERAYLDEWPMTEEQKQAVLARDLNRCIAAGGNIYFLAKIGATDGKSFQQMAGSMTGMSEDEYRAMMISGGRSADGNRYVGEDGDAQAHRQPQGAAGRAARTAKGG